MGDLPSCKVRLCVQRDPQRSATSSEGLDSCETAIAPESRNPTWDTALHLALPSTLTSHVVSIQLFDVKGATETRMQTAVLPLQVCVCVMATNSCCGCRLPVAVLHVAIRDS